MSKMDSVLPLLKNELLEVSVGDEYEELLTSDTVKKINGVIYGVLLNIIDDLMVLDCYYLNKNNQLVSGNIVYINTWAVKMFTKANSEGSLKDVMLSAAHTRKMKEILGLND